MKEIDIQELRKAMTASKIVFFIMFILTLMTLIAYLYDMKVI